MEGNVESDNGSNDRLSESEWDEVGKLSEQEKREHYREVGEKTLEVTKDGAGEDSATIDVMDEETKEAFLGLMEDYRSRGIRARDAFLYDQRVFEKELNARLTKVDELEAMSNIEGSGVRKDYTDYLGHRITVYVLEGYPFEMLMSWISGEGSEPGGGREKLAQERLDHPELWMKSRGEIVREAGGIYGRKGLYSDTISCSYRDSSEHYSTDVGTGALAYCFDHVAANSVKITDGSDSDVQGRTPDSFDIPTKLNNETWTLAEDGRTYLSEKSRNHISVKRIDDFPTHIQNYDMFGDRRYNEIAIARYDEVGNPIKPDFIKPPVGGINENSKKHAAFFNVPIVVVDDSKYEYPLHKEEEKWMLKDSMMNLEGWIENRKFRINAMIEKETMTEKKVIGNLLSKDFDKWSEMERARNPGLYSLMQEKRMIEVSPRDESDRRDRINEYENKLRVIIQNDLNSLRQYLEAENLDGTSVKNELKDYERFCRGLAATPRSEWTKDQVKECNYKCLSKEQFMDVARDLELLKKVIPLKVEDKKVRLSGVLDRIKKQTDKEASEQEQELRSLVETPPENWAEKDKRFSKELYSLVLELRNMERAYRKYAERYDALSGGSDFES